MAGVVDTSVLYAAMDVLDPHHDTANKMLRAHLGLEAPPAIIAEAELLLRKRAGRKKALSLIGDLLADNPHVGVMDADLHPEALRIWKTHSGLSYTDAHAIAGALRLGDGLVTLDKRQEAVWKKERKQRSR